MRCKTAKPGAPGATRSDSIEKQPSPRSNHQANRRYDAQKATVKLPQSYAEGFSAGQAIDYLAEGSFGIASHFIRFPSEVGPFFSSHALISLPTFCP